MYPPETELNPEAEALGCKPNHGGTIMGELYALGLVVRRENGPRVEWLERRSPIQEEEQLA